MKLKITPIGNSFGVILPKETLAKLKVSGGDAVFSQRRRTVTVSRLMTRSSKPK